MNWLRDKWGRYIKVDRYEWAGGVASSGFPIYAITPRGIIQIGWTSWEEDIYRIPDDTIAIVRTYITSTRHKQIHVYTTDKHWVLDDRNLLRSPPDLPKEIRPFLKKIRKEGFKRLKK